MCPLLPARPWSGSGARSAHELGATRGTPSLAPGLWLGSYVLVRPLGCGAMGEVWEARDAELQRRVALKVLPPELAADRGRLKRFQREAKVVAALSHPNVVTLHAVERAVPAATRRPADASAEGSPTAPELHFLVMELVEGETLEEAIPAGGFDLPDLFRLAVPLAEALAAAHREGIVHRDLKPANVMVTSDGGVKVLDFGLAKLTLPAQPLASLRGAPTATFETRSGMIVGTVAYMAPEQLRGEASDRRADIFSLGVVLYEMATGARPFRGGSSPEVASAILRDTPRPTDTLRDDLPHHLERIIRRCLEKDPERRFQTAADVRNELRDLAAEILTPPSVAPAVGAPLAPTWWTSRRPTLPRALGGRRAARGAVAAALGVVAIVSLAARQGASPTASPTATAARPVATVAVLPFADLTHDPGHSALVAGLHEALITSLTQRHGLRVASRTSVMRFAGTEEPLPRIAATLGVDALVEGSALLVGDHLRIDARLIRRDDRHLWGASYDLPRSDEGAVFDEVPTAIAAAIEAAIAPDDAPTERDGP